jgi:hypothetical protein
MTFSTGGKYRGTSGTLTVGSGNLVFTRVDGIISQSQRLVISIPLNAIVNINVEGVMFKKLVVLVDGSKVPGIPRHEFEVGDPYNWVNAIRYEISINQQSQPQYSPQPQQMQSQREVIIKETVREIVKIPCSFCGTLNEITEKRCSGCGGSVGQK